MDSISTSLQRKFRIAYTASLMSNYRHQVGAAIFYKNQFISWGYNNMKTHPKFANESNSYVVHAEISALIRAQWNRSISLKGCSIYVYRGLKDGSLGLAKPCDACMAALIDAHLKWVRYTDYDGVKEIKLY